MTTEPLRPYIKIVNPIDYVIVDSFKVKPASGFGPPKGEYAVEFTGHVSEGFPLDGIVLKDLSIALGREFRDVLYVSTFTRLGDVLILKSKTTHYLAFKPGDVGLIEKVSWMDDGRRIELIPRRKRVGSCYLMARTPLGMRVLSRKVAFIPQTYRTPATPAWKGNLEFYFFLSPVDGEWSKATACTGYPPPPPPPPPQPAPPTAITPTVPPETIEQAVAAGLAVKPPPRYGPCLNKLTDGCERIFVVDFEYVPNPFTCTTSARTNGYVILSMAGAQEFKLDYTTTHGNPVVEVTIARGISGYMYRANSIYVNGVPLKPPPWYMAIEYPAIATFYL